MKTSLPKKLETLKPGESMILPTENPAGLMRTIGAHQYRGAVSRAISYKKARIIVDDVLFFGVMITRPPAPIVPNKDISISTTTPNKDIPK
jgi:hypothetical protein